MYMFDLDPASWAALVAQLVRASVRSAECRGFKSHLRQLFHFFICLRCLSFFLSFFPSHVIKYMYVIATCSGTTLDYIYTKDTLPTYYKLIASRLTPHSWYQYSSPLHTVTLNPAHLHVHQYQHYASNHTILAISHIRGTSTQAHYTQ